MGCVEEHPAAPGSPGGRALRAGPLSQQEAETQSASSEGLPSSTVVAFGNCRLTLCCSKPWNNDFRITASTPYSGWKPSTTLPFRTRISCIHPEPWKVRVEESQDLTQEPTPDPRTHFLIYNPGIFKTRINEYCFTVASKDAGQTVCHEVSVLPPAPGADSQQSLQSIMSLW